MSYLLNFNDDSYTAIEQPVWLMKNNIILEIHV